MELRLLAAISGEIEELNIAAFCREKGISRKTFYKWRRRYAEEGLDGLSSRSRRPHAAPQRIRDDIEERIVATRKRLVDWGLDAGPATIRMELRWRCSPVPSEATIWRALTRRGFITPAPKKRPRSSYRRFEADAPNECWQIDATEWPLIGGAHADIVNIVDDHSRLAVASTAVAATTTEAAWAVFHAASSRWGLPTRCLSDNGLAFSGKIRGFEVFFEANLRAAGIRPVTSRPYHPQTCGKVERFQQTLKKWLRAKPAVATLDELQAHLDAFCDYYNHHRPHRSLDRQTPFVVWARSAPARPESPQATPTFPGRRANRLVSRSGVVAVAGQQVGVGRRFAGRYLEVITDGRHALVLIDGEIHRRLEIDHSRGYQS